HGKRGPKSQTRDHFLPPAAITTNGEKRWTFKCRHCDKSVTVKRTVAKTQLFGDEKPAPPLGNLATHYNHHHQGEPVPSDVTPGQARDVSASSAKIMGDFLVEGKLNPVINTTQGNFLKIFAAWIVEDDLPFTTGETPGIQCLFAFLHTRFHLPSDTSKRYVHFYCANKICLTRFHLLAAALDNASPNDVLIRTLSRLLMERFDVQFTPENSQIRCLDHVVHLVVQKMLAALEEAVDPD
ncbi:hypothetical protein DFH07DRAFT_684213, partial [Mycena maculata]